MFSRMLRLTGCLSLIFLLCGCGYEIVGSEELMRLKAAEAEVVRLREENAQLKTQLASVKDVGRYQIHQSGFRTWRLDTATGQDCLLLTSDADWKKPAVSMQGCPPQ